MSLFYFKKRKCVHERSLKIKRLRAREKKSELWIANREVEDESLKIGCLCRLRFLESQPVML